MRKIIRNAIRCNHCGDVIESTYRHNYVQCSCGKVAVDGGHDYFRRSYSGNHDDFTDLSECVEVDEKTVKIHSFALKWLQKYQDDKTPGGELEECFAPDCFDLGFEMDCGESFGQHYSTEAFNDPVALKTIIATIDDPMLLGAAIFSKWRAITHWWNEDLFSPKHRAWFILAFKHLADITR